jgi:hypothetical protein
MKSEVENSPESRLIDGPRYTCLLRHRRRRPGLQTVHHEKQTLNSIYIVKHMIYATMSQLSLFAGKRRAESLGVRRDTPAPPRLLVETSTTVLTYLGIGENFALEPRIGNHMRDLLLLRARVDLSLPEHAEA